MLYLPRLFTLSVPTPYRTGYQQNRHARLPSVCQLVKPGICIGHGYMAASRLQIYAQTAGTSHIGNQLLAIVQDGFIMFVIDKGDISF